MAQSSTINGVLRQFSPAVSNGQTAPMLTKGTFSDPKTLLSIILGIDNFASDLLLT